MVKWRTFLYFTISCSFKYNMTIEYLKLIKIDHENNIVQEEPLNSEGNVKDYVMDIVGQITDNAGERRYRFKDEWFCMCDVFFCELQNYSKSVNKAHFPLTLLLLQRSGDKRMYSPAISCRMYNV